MGEANFYYFTCLHSIRVARQSFSPLTKPCQHVWTRKIWQDKGQSQESFESRGFVVSRRKGSSSHEKRQLCGTCWFWCSRVPGRSLGVLDGGNPRVGRKCGKRQQEESGHPQTSAVGDS